MCVSCEISVANQKEETYIQAYPEMATISIAENMILDKQLISGLPRSSPIN